MTDEQAEIARLREERDSWRRVSERLERERVKAEQEYADLFASTSDLLKRFREYCESNPPFAKRNKPEGAD